MLTFHDYGVCREATVVQISESANCTQHADLSRHEAIMLNVFVYHYDAGIIAACLDLSKSMASTRSQINVAVKMYNSGYGILVWL